MAFIILTPEQQQLPAHPAPPAPQCAALTPSCSRNTFNLTSGAALGGPSAFLCLGGGGGTTSQQREDCCGMWMISFPWAKTGTGEGVCGVGVHSCCVSNSVSSLRRAHQRAISKRFTWICMHSNTVGVAGQLVEPRPARLRGACGAELGRSLFLGKATANFNKAVIIITNCRAGFTSCVRWIGCAVLCCPEDHPRMTHRLCRFVWLHTSTGPPHVRLEPAIGALRLPAVRASRRPAP